MNVSVGLKGTHFLFLIERPVTEKSKILGQIGLSKQCTPTKIRMLIQDVDCLPFLLYSVLEYGKITLTHILLASHFWGIGKQCRPRQTPQNTASDQGLHCFLTGISIKNMIKMKKYTRDPLMKNGLIQLIRMGKSIWVN